MAKTVTVGMKDERIQSENLKKWPKLSKFIFNALIICRNKCTVQNQKDRKQKDNN